MLNLPLAGPGKQMVWLGVIVAAASWLTSVFGTDLIYVGLAFAAFSAVFFRDPEREVKPDPKDLLSPADGKVISVKQEGPEGTSTIRIFMSILNVHVQRAPAGGKVTDIAYHKGGFAMANTPEAARNEKNIISIVTPDGKFVIVEQIAGFIARRVACWVRKGEDVRQGQRIGMIYFGSQVALHVPKGFSVVAREGGSVSAGISVMAVKGAAEEGK